MQFITWYCDVIITKQTMEYLSHLDKFVCYVLKNFVMVPSKSIQTPSIFCS